MATPTLSVPLHSGIFAAASVPNAALVNASVTVTAGTGLAGGGSVALGASVSLSLPNTGPGAGAQTLATGDSITLDAQGRITAVSTVTRQILSGTGITGGGNLTADRTLAVDQSFSPTWTGAHTWSTGTATFAASAAKINNAGATFASSLVSAATAARTWTLPDATDTAVGLAATQTLTNKTISGASNTLSNIGNASLTNSSVTVTAGTGLSGGGAVSLGSSVTLSLPSVGPGAGTVGGSGIASITLDAQGRVTAATTATYLTSATVFYQTFQNAGTSVTQRALASFGGGLQAVDNAGATRTDVSIATAGVTNAMLANSSLTVTAGTGLSGGGAVSLGSSVTLSLPNTGPGAGTIGGAGNWITGITLDAQGRVTAATSTAQTANLLTGSLTSGVAPVASGANTLANSSFTMAGAVFDLASAATMFVGNGVASAVSIGSTNIITYLGGTGPSTGTGSVRVFNPIYQIASAATSGTTLVSSPFYYFQSNVWISGASTTYYGGIRMVPSSITPHGYLQFNIGPSGLSEVGRVDDLGIFYALPGGGFDVMTAGAANFGATVATSVTVGSSTSATTVLKGTSTSVVSTAAANGQAPFSDTTNAFTGGNSVWTWKTGGSIVANVTAQGSFQSLNGTYETQTVGVQLNLGTGVAGNIRIGAPANQTTIATNTVVIGDGTTTARSLIGGFQAAAGSGITTGVWTVFGATGAASDGTTTAGVAGQITTVRAGSGGAGSGAFAPGAGANLNLLGGNGGASGTGNSSGGNVVIDGGALSGTGSGGIVLLGNGANTSSITIGRSGLPGGITIQGTTVFSGNVSQSTGTFSLTGNGASSITTTAGALTITAAAASTWNSLNGALKAASLDVSTATTLSLGTSTATAVAIGLSGITTTITGSLTQLTGAFSLTGNAQSQLTTTTGSLVLDSAASALVDIGVTTTGGIAIGRSAITTTINGTVSLPNSVTMATGSFTYSGAMSGSSTAFTFRSTNADTIGDRLMSWGGTSEEVYLSQTFSSLYEFRSNGTNIGLRNSNGDGITAQGAGSVYIYGNSTAQVKFQANTSVTDVTGILSFGTSGAPWASIGATLVNTYSPGTTSRSASYTSNNVTASTNSQPQWAPGSEYVGHGWTYLPGVVSNAGAMTRTSNVVSVTTTAAHGFASGINIYVYVGDTNFPTGTYGPITVTGTTTFTLSWTGANAASSAAFNLFDATGQDQTVKVSTIMRPVTGTPFTTLTRDNGMSAPELVHYRTAYPNNGAYAEWFKFSATDPLGGNTGFNSTGGVTMRTRTSGADGSFLSLQPGVVALFDDNSFGIRTFANPGQPLAGVVSISGQLLSYAGANSTSGLLGASVGGPTQPWFDFFGVRGDFQNVGVGDIASLRWGDQITNLSYWFSSSGASSTPYGLLTVGGGARHQAMASAAGAAVAQVGTAGTTTYGYIVIASDRNGWVSMPIFQGTGLGNATLSAAAYNNVTWTAPVNGGANCRYDVFRGTTITGTTLTRAGTNIVTVTGATAHGLTTGASFYVTGGTGTATFASGVFVVVSVASTSSFTYLDASSATTGTFTANLTPLTVSQASWVGTTSGLFFHDTGAARYSSPSAGTLFAPSIVSTTPAGGSGSSIQYGVYALDADNRLIGSALGTAGVGGAPSPTNPWTIVWTPIGGAASYLVTRGDLSHPIQFQAGQNSFRGGGTSSSFVKVNSSTTVTVTIANGHGLKVGDSITISALSSTTWFAAVTTTVVSVTSATVFTYSDATPNTSGSTQTVTGTATGPFITTYQFVDYGYPTRAIGPVTRNNTADVVMDGQLTLNAQSAGMAFQMTGNAANFSALASWRDAANNLHFGIDDAGLPSLGNRTEFRETWMWAGSLSAANASPVTNSSTVWNFTLATGAPTYSAATGWSGYGHGGGIQLNLPVTSGTTALLATNVGLFSLAHLTNIYGVLEWAASLSIVGANNYTYNMGFSNGTMGSANPGGAFFQKTSANTNWQCVTNNAGTTTSTILDSGVAPVAGVQNNFRIEHYGAGSTVGATTIKFYIDNTLVATSNILTAVHATSPVKIQFAATATATATAQTLQIGSVMMMYNNVATPLAT